MEFTAGEIAQMLGGEIEGNAQEKVNDISKIEEGRPMTLTFLSNPKYQEFIYSTQASVALVNKDFQAEKKIPSTLTLIRVEDAYSSLSILLDAYEKASPEYMGVHEKAFVHETAVLGEKVYVGPNATIGMGVVLAEGVKVYANAVIQDNCQVGKDTVIHSNCTLYRGTQVGNNCILHSGAIIGADGFGFAPRGSAYSKVPQIGKVVIEDHVEIGANTCIDRATMGATVIKEGVKLDNLIQVAHNVVIGENTVIAAQTGIAGSTKIGKNCMIGGQVGIVGHLHIADEVKIAAQSGIGQSIEEKGAIMQGSPAISNRDFKRAYVYFVKLPELKARVDRLEKGQQEH